MPPTIRNQVANLLGWSLFTSKQFGDPHAEAWSIINSNSDGLQARSNKSWEKVNILGRNVNWYDILTRELQGILHKRTKNNPSRSETLDACQHKSKIITDLENKFLYYLSLEEEKLQQQMKKDTAGIEPTETAKGKAALDYEQLSIIKDRIIKNTGISRKETLSYSLGLTKTLLRLPGTDPLAITMLCATSASTIVPALTTVVAPVAALLTTLATPLFVIGIIGLVQQGVTLGLGSSEGRLFAPIVVILHQKILCAVEGINIDDYY